IALPGLVLSGIGMFISTYHYLIQKWPLLRDSGDTCGIIPCHTQYINYFGFITIPFLAGVAFIVIFVVHIIIIKQARRHTLMRNKMIIIVGVIVVLFGALYFVNDYKNKQTINDNENPYGDKKLEQATIAQLDDPLYKNQIMPEKLKEKVDNGESVTVYFYSPEC